MNGKLIRSLNLIQDLSYQLFRSIRALTDWVFLPIEIVKSTLLQKTLKVLNGADSISIVEGHTIRIVKVDTSESKVILQILVFKDDEKLQAKYNQIKFLFYP